VATRTQKTKVGAFLVICFGLITAIITVVAGAYQQEGETHYILFEESVSGLYEGAPVQYLGVPIGKVSRITVNEFNQIEVQITVDPAKATLYSGVQAELVIYGFAAGTMAISLSGGDRDRGAIPPNSTIGSRGSTLTAIGAKADEILESIKNLADTITTQVQGVDGEPGIVAKVNTVVDRVEEITHDVQRVLQTANTTIGNADTHITRVTDEAIEFSGDVRNLARNADGLVGEVREKVAVLDVKAIEKNLNITLENVASITSQLEETAAGLAGTISTLEHQADNVSYAASTSLDELREALRTVADLANQLRQDPASLLRGRGEPR
jgi:phospholipid/cholesterol/gamma-HCH transport system substrate-binding protein